MYDYSILLLYRCENDIHYSTITWISPLGLQSTNEYTILLLIQCFDNVFKQGSHGNTLNIFKHI